ncbi:MFS general substrate transporter [Pisolithus croceorrhizus]|nr:MFS general substrate transporter [Pisolithus croceorrhizus]
MQKVTFKDSTAVFTLDEPRRPDEYAPGANLSVEELPYLWASPPLAVSFEPEKPLTREIPDFPDGGMRAWSVVIGALFMSFGTQVVSLRSFGWINSFGVFQTYYEEYTFPEQSASNISWIGSIQYGLIFIPALLTGRLLDLGYYNGPLAISSAFYVAALFFAGMLFGSTPAIVSHWFLKKRSQAFGCPCNRIEYRRYLCSRLITQQLFGKVGFKWSVRAVAFIITFAIIAANLLLRPRLPPSNVKGGLFDWSAFKNPAYACCVLAYNVSLLGLYVPLIYLDLSGQAAGFSPNFTFYLISIANGASLIGRLSSGILADRFGALNTLIPFTLIGAVASFAWPYATSNIPSLVVVSIIYGCATGAFVSLIPSAPARLGGMSDAGRRYGLGFLTSAVITLLIAFDRIGMAITCMAFGATGGPPLAGVIRTKSGGFDDVGLYSGGIILLGCILLAITRYLALGKWVGKF